MTDNTELKRLAEAANAVTSDARVEMTIASEPGPNQAEIDAVTAFMGAATPAAVVALIAENERLRADCSSMRGSLKTNAVSIKKLIKDGGRAARERDQLKAELATERQRRWDGNESAALERDEDVRKLRAEIAGLKTGNEAYEQVNAEMKAEVEVLRKDADRAAYWKQRAKSAEGHLFSGDFRAAAMELHKYSRFESTPWPELTGSQHALISSAAGAVIATVNRLRDARRPKNRDETDAIIWCACGDGHAANSYGAGFMDANNGVCANCGAALGQGEQS